MSDDRFLGPAFPLGPTVETSFGPKSALESIWTSIVNILTTPKGSCRWDRSIGSIVPYLIFEPNDAVTQGLVRHYTFKDLSEQEPRIRVRAVNTTADEHVINVTVGFSIVGDPSARVYNAPVSYNLAA